MAAAKGLSELRPVDCHHFGLHFAKFLPVPLGLCGITTFAHPSSQCCISYCVYLGNWYMYVIKICITQVVTLPFACVWKACVNVATQEKGWYIYIFGLSTPLTPNNKAPTSMLLSWAIYNSAFRLHWKYLAYTPTLGIMDIKGQRVPFDSTRQYPLGGVRYRKVQTAKDVQSPGKSVSGTQNKIKPRNV